jgi:hydroxymethylpyrimidine kinase/phosphomethylpyrimidine kinase/thiamine-phosphate diphosphorylase
MINGCNREMRVDGRLDHQRSRPIVWAIGGTDSGGGAGLLADIRTMLGLGAHPCTIVTAVTAQSSRGVDSIWPVAGEGIDAQWRALESDLPPSSVKVGMVPSADHAKLLAALLARAKVPIVLDPVLRASAGGTLADEATRAAIVRELLPLVDILTPNLDEAGALLGLESLEGPASIEEAARSLAALGPETVVIKGGHGGGPFSQDCVFHRGRIFWLSNDRLPSQNTHGTGCTFASAIAAAIATGLSIVDAIIVAKMFVTGAIRNSYPAGAGSGPVAQGTWSEEEADLPWLTPTAEAAVTRHRFPRLEQSLGLYAIVDSADWVERFIGSEVGAIQLRVKSLREGALRNEIARAIRAARDARIPLFINDYWPLAIELDAFGVHLGQEDLDTADLTAIESAGLRLGVSTHCYEEVARAHALRPSYLAIGPIFETKIKVMKFEPQGVPALRRWRRTLTSYTLVAIGGIDVSTITEVAMTGVDSIAVIRAITKAPDPLQAVRELAARMRD